MLGSNCSHNQDIMKMWMTHQAECRPLPVEWLSKKAKLLTDDENQRPNTILSLLISENEDDVQQCQDH